jgi:hypothetical protein
MISMEMEWGIQCSAEEGGGAGALPVSLSLASLASLSSSKPSKVFACVLRLACLREEVDEEWVLAHWAPQNPLSWWWWWWWWRERVFASKGGKEISAALTN